MIPPDVRSSRLMGYGPFEYTIYGLLTEIASKHNVPTIYD